MAYERVNWENLPSTKTPVNADNLNKMENGFATSQRWRQILLGFKYSFNNKNVVYAGTEVANFTNGVVNIDISDLNLSARPDAVQITPNSRLYSIRYDFDNSSAQSIRVEIFNNGQTYNYNGNVRFSITIYGIEN